MRSPYEVLGVAKTAPDDEIKSLMEESLGPVLGRPFRPPRGWRDHLGQPTP